MEISSNSASLKRPQGTPSQFSFSSDTQEGSTFDLLLALPISVSQDLDREPVVGDSSSDAPDVSSCPECDYKPESETGKETDSEAVAESNEPSEDSSQAITAASIASIDAIAAQQKSNIEEPTAEQPVQAQVEEQPKVDSVEITSELIRTQVVKLQGEEPSVADHQPAPVLESEVPSTTVDAPIAKSEAIGQPATATDAVKLQQTQARENQQPEQFEKNEQQTTSSKVTNPTTHRDTEVTDSGQDVVAESPENTRDTSTSSAESTRRSAIRERPERWYERDRNELQSDESESLLQLPESEVEQSVEPALSADLAGSGSQPGEQFTSGEAESSEFAIVAEDQAVATSDAGGRPVVAVAISNNLHASESTSISSNDAMRPVASSVERNQSRSAESTSKLESSQTGPQVDITRAEKARLVQRVARSFTRLGATGGNIQLKLHPPELGALAVQVRIEGKNMTAKLTTESQAAKEVIMESLPQLRSRLAEQGFDVVQFTVDVSSDSSSLGNNSGAGQTGAGQGEQFGSSPDGESGQTSSFNMRRANYLRRQLDSANVSTQSFASSGIGRGVDIQA